MAQVKSHQRMGKEYKNNPWKLKYNTALAAVSEPQDCLLVGAVPRVLQGIVQKLGGRSTAGPKQPCLCFWQKTKVNPASDVTREASLYAYPSVHAT